MAADMSDFLRVETNSSHIPAFLSPQNGTTKKRTQQLRQSAKNATKSRQPIEDDIPSDPDPAPGTDASIEEPFESHEEHSPHCSHDRDFDLGDELPDLDCDSDDECEEMDDQVVAAPEISEESELKKFATLLSDAQEAARIKERARETNGPKKYNGNSSKTKYRQHKFGKDIEAKGFLNVFDFMKAKAKKAAQEPARDHNSPHRQPGISADCIFWGNHISEQQVNCDPLLGPDQSAHRVCAAKGERARTPDSWVKGLIPIPANFGKILRFACAKSRQFWPKFAIDRCPNPDKISTTGEALCRISIKSSGYSGSRQIWGKLWRPVPIPAKWSKNPKFQSRQVGLRPEQAFDPTIRGPIAHRIESIESSCITAKTVRDPHEITPIPHGIRRQSSTPPPRNGSHKKPANRTTSTTDGPRQRNHTSTATSTSNDVDMQTAPQARKVGDTYDPDMLSEDRGEFFDHSPDIKIIQRNYCDVNNSLITPWNLKKELTEGAFFSAQITLHTYIFYPTGPGVPSKVYHLYVDKLRILDKGYGAPWEIPIPSLPPAGGPSTPRKRKERDEVADDAFEVFDTVSPRKK
ncbi:hypothetical protein B0H14DRAFT_2603474 [Mycena olivaceomarginata]|nr:hypothetical protein B0H14DRAFT_2603474 [Mycena olivaceomarginata]